MIKLSKSLLFLTVMTLQEIFNSIKPVLDSYITEKHELEKRILQEGTLPDEVITECPIHDIVKVEKFDKKTIESTKNFVKWIQENKISWIEGDTKNIYLRSKLQKIEGKKGKLTVDSMLLSREQGLQKNKIEEYEFKFALSSLKNKDFYNILSSYPFRKSFTCEHLNPDTITEAKPVILSTKNVDRIYIGERNRTLTDALETSSTNSNLQLFCNDCYRRIDHLCCKNSIDKRGISYEANHRHPLDTILLKLNLKKQNLSFSEIITNDRFGGESLQFFLTDYKALLTEQSRDLDQTIEKLKPEIVIVQGNKQSIIDYLKHDVQLIIFDDSKDAKQRFFLFDKDKKVEENIEKCCLHIIRNLETYSEKIRAKEHDKLIVALEKIGHELGYVPKIIEQFQIWYNPKPDPQKYVRPDINSICSVLDSFVGFMDESHEDIIISVNKKTGNETILKKKSPKTIQLYFSWIKLYLRSVHGIKISSEDVRDLITFPNQAKYQREALTLKQLKAIMENSSSRRRCLSMP